ncbi:MAG: DedA family protein [Patescibacteria group bacterium]
MPLESFPIELSLFIATFLEELFPPIPAYFLYITAGSISAIQGDPIWYLAVIAMIGAAGKTCGSTLIYVAADKLEDLIVPRFGKYVGIRHKEVESLGKHFQRGRRDSITIFLLRLLPLVPSTPVSLLCGIIKLNLKTYVAGTFFGTLLKNIAFVYVGYAGIDIMQYIPELRIEERSLIAVAAIVFGLILGIKYIQTHRSEVVKQTPK